MPSPFPQSRVAAGRSLPKDIRVLKGGGKLSAWAGPGPEQRKDISANTGDG